MAAAAPNYPALTGSVDSLNVAARPIPATIKTEAGTNALTKLGDFGGGAILDNVFGKGKAKYKKPKTPLANQIYNKGIQTLQGYNALLGPTQDLMRAAAQGDLEQFKSLAPGYVEAISTADPMQARLRTALNTSAMDELALGSRLDPVELRRVQQQSRMNRTGGGFGQGSENDVFNESLDIATRGRDLYDRRFGNAMGVSRLNLAATGDPLLAVTGRPSGVTGLGDVPQDSRNLLLTEERERANKKAAEDANRTALYAAGINAVGSIAGGASHAI